MSDALLALRAAIQSSQPITYSVSNPQIHISPSYDFPKSTPTRWRKGPSSTSTLTVSHFYTLEAVYLAWHLKALPGAEYAKQARESGSGFVSVTERKGVVDWLEGSTSAGEGRIVSEEIFKAAVSEAQSQAGGLTPPGSPPAHLKDRYSKSTTSVFSSTSSATTLPPTSSPTKRRYVPDTADIDAVKRIKTAEIELRDRTSVLRGTKPNNFSSIRTLFAERLKKLKEGGSAAAGGKSSTASSSTSTNPALAAGMDSKMVARKARHNFPIIIISSSPTALITMHNVKRFLQESTFEPTADARARATAEGNTRPDDLIPIDRKITHIESGGRESVVNVRYFVLDSVDALSKFGPDAWDRVVCVMTTGQAWQFRPYKWAEPRVLFHHVKGVYVSWANDPPNPKIKDWNVTELKIDPLRRHIDKSVVAGFWKMLDDWMGANKPWLMKS